MSSVVADRTRLPLTDERSTAPHTADECNLERCPYCGCCCHGKRQRAGCKVDLAPLGMRCPEVWCGCEGRS